MAARYYGGPDRPQPGRKRCRSSPFRPQSNDELPVEILEMTGGRPGVAIQVVAGLSGRVQGHTPYPQVVSGPAVVVITGAPGAGKSATIEALSNRLTDAGIEHGAIELEQLGWGHPWLAFVDTLAQLRAVLAAQRQHGRRLFLIAATTETDDELADLVDAVRETRVLTVALRARPETVSSRVLRREPVTWSGRHRLAAHSSRLAVTIPRLRGVDLTVDTDQLEPPDVARCVFDAMTADRWSARAE